MTRDEIKAAADRAYCRFLEMCQHDHCRGEVFKIENGKFTMTNLEAHRRAHEQLGRHRAFMEVYNATADDKPAPALVCETCKGSGYVYSPVVTNAVMTGEVAAEPCPSCAPSGE